MVLLLYGAAAALVVVLDQLSKYLAVGNLIGAGTVRVIPGLFNFVYVENTGAAFGMMKGQRWIFMILSTVLIVALAVYLVLTRKKTGFGMGIAISMIIGGGIGNQIDRFVRGYVVDFIEFGFFRFPVFNVADSFVTIGAFLLVILITIEEIREYKNGKGKKAESEKKNED